MHKYWGFGLLISSTVEFPELMPATSPHTDVTIAIGMVPVIHASATFCTGRITYDIVNDAALLFTVDGIATYYVADGNRIIISPLADDVEPRVLRMFVLAGAMAGILQQRKKIPLHAAGIVTDGGLTLITGHSGAGKSTTLAGLQEKKYPIFTDDITVLHHCADDDRVRGTAAYPMLKLWEQSMQTLQLHDRSFPVMPGMEKYGVFFHQDFDTQHYPIRRIILLATADIDEIRHVQLNGSMAFTQVIQHIYKPVLFRQPAVRAVCFHMISAMTRQAVTHCVTRPLQSDPAELLTVVKSLL
ncbi:phosphoenolpyruvate carboxykinase (ATP) [Chitinophaga agri]|uniref:Serine kinase n=1 Tax=Chitinophaga agri TaxID=2703787 RepID=A0A6B9Z807_9BACT|nr:hypothetical protein [Chitinophaga agri]QHS58127.1 hypothetical protein GWR21_00510 [Chitinophaga agri]